MCNTCSCGTNNTQASAAPATDTTASPSTVDTFNVAGMTCGHCVSAVSAGIGQVDGVTSVEVDLTSGAVTIASGTALDRGAVRAAVEEAGYQLA